MKIALLGDDSSPEKMNSFTGLWSYYLPKALKELGVNVELLKLNLNEFNRLSESEKEARLDDLDVSAFDHVVALGLRFFSTTPKDATERLRTRITGCLGHIYDGGLLDNLPADITFTFKNDDWLYPPGSPNSRYNRHLDNNKYIGWAADGKLLTPKQDEKELRILVDHPAFAASQKDQTLTVLINIKNLVTSPKLWGKFESISVKMIVDGGVNDVDLDNIQVKPYNRKSIPFKDIVDEYSKAHIFMVTHKETVGLTMLETATAGALVVAPKGLAPLDRLETIRHIETDGAIDWRLVLKLVNPDLCSSYARKNSWGAVAQRLITHLMLFNKSA